MTRDVYCSFCRKSYRDGGPLVEGPGDVFICGDCIELCQSIIEQVKARRNRPPHDRSPAECAHDIRAKLDRLVTGQDKTKEALTGVAANRTQSTGHILLIGPSPSSMAFLARALAHVLEVPFGAGDRRALVEPNRGNPIPLLFRLLDAGGFDLEACQQGVVYVDGVDLSEAQKALLSLWQGQQGEFMDRIGLDARRVLFICGGAFTGLDDLMARSENLQQESSAREALLAFGVQPEWLKHFAAIARVAPLDEDALARLVKWVDFPRAEQEAEAGASQSQA
jgi:ATP-dependent Clp protease ATP-binding subunit ClpX